MKGVGNGIRRLFIPMTALLIAAACSATALAGSLTAEDKRLTKAAFAAIDQEHWAQAKDIIARAKNPLARKLIDWLDLRQAGPGRAFAVLCRSPPPSSPPPSSPPSAAGLLPSPRRIRLKIAKATPRVNEECGRSP